jgi:hypothetical protein
MPAHRQLNSRRLSLEMSDSDGDGGVSLHGMATESLPALDLVSHTYEDDASLVPYPGVSYASMNNSFEDFLDLDINPPFVLFNPSPEASASQGAIDHQHTANGPMANPDGTFQDGATSVVLTPLPDDPMDDLGDVLLSNPNPHILGSGNLDLASFLRIWSTPHSRTASHSGQLRPLRQEALAQCYSSPREILYSDLKDDKCDLQGLNWETMGITRNAARARRHRKHQNHTNRKGSDNFMVSLSGVAFTPLIKDRT